MLEACEHAQVDAALALISHGVRVDGRHGAEAVAVACSGVGGRQAVEIVRLLARHGARVDDDAFYRVLATADVACDPFASYHEQFSRGQGRRERREKEEEEEEEEG